MKKILKTYDNLEEKLLIFSLALNVLIVFFQVIMRSLFNTSLSWSEEITRYIFIWQIWMGASIAYRENEHIRVNLIFSVAKSKTAKKFINILVDIIWLAFNLALVYIGFKLLASIHSRNAVSSGLRLPLIYVYAALPISSIIISIRQIIDIISISTGKTEVNDMEMESDL